MIIVKNSYSLTLLIIAVLSLFTRLVWAQDMQKNFSAQLNMAFKKVQSNHSLSMNFQQEFYSALRNKITISSGLLQVQSPKSWKFIIEKPKMELYVSNGYDFWKYIPAIKYAQHVVLNNHNSEFDYLALFTNLTLVKKFYELSAWTEPVDSAKSSSNTFSFNNFSIPPKLTSHNLLIKLQPKEDKMQKVLYAALNLTSGVLTELRIMQANDNCVRLVFSNVKTEYFSAANFNFRPPHGISID